MKKTNNNNNKNKNNKNNAQYALIFDDGTMVSEYLFDGIDEITQYMNDEFENSNVDMSSISIYELKKSRLSLQRIIVVDDNAMTPYV